MTLFLPVATDREHSGFTPAVLLIIAVNFLVYLATAGSHSEMLSTFREWGLVPGSSGLARIVTSMFLHGSFLHFFGNMLFLAVFGPAIEERLGFGRFIGLYLLFGAGAGLLYVIVTTTWVPAGMGIPCVGASGAVCGVMGYFLHRFPDRKVSVWYFIWILVYLKAGCFSVSAAFAIGFYFLSDLFWGLVVAGTGAALSTAYWAHIGGFLAGIGLSYWLGARDETSFARELVARTRLTTVPLVKKRRSFARPTAGPAVAAALACAKMSERPASTVALPGATRPDVWSMRPATGVTGTRKSVKRRVTKLC